MKRFRTGAAMARPLMLILLTAMLLCAGRASAQGAFLAASAVPDAYYEPFSSQVTVTVTNTSETEITVTGLMVEDVSLPGIGAVLMPSESKQLSLNTRITDAMLNAGHFYVTVYYTYTDAQGLSIPSINQIMVPVRRMEDKVEASVRFALPDRPIDGEESVPVSYILENIGETNMVNAVLICYPEGYFTAPMSLPAGAYTVIKRSVSVSDLDKISAKLSAQSAYSGKEYTLEQVYSGSLSELAMSAEECGLPAASNQPAALTPTEQPEAQEPGAASAPASAGIRARQSGDTILITVSAGNETLQDVRILVNGETLRTLVLLKEGLSAVVPFTPDGGEAGEYVFSMSALSPDGEVRTIGEDTLSYTLASGVQGDAPANEEETDLFSRIIEGPRLTNIIVYGCAAVLLVLLLLGCIGRVKRRHKLTTGEEKAPEPEKAGRKNEKKARRKEKS